MHTGKSRLRLTWNAAMWCTRTGGAVWQRNQVALQSNLPCTTELEDTHEPNIQRNHGLLKNTESSGKVLLSRWPKVVTSSNRVGWNSRLLAVKTVVTVCA